MALSFAALVFSLLARPVDVDAAERSGYGSEAIKVAYTFNFARYTRWPKAHASRALRICVIGRTDQFRAFEVLKKRSVGSRSIAVAQLASDAPTAGCDILFVGSGVPLPKVCGVERSDALTVTDRSDCPSMVQLFQSGDQVRFNVDLERIRAAGLSLNPKLLALAANLRK